MTTTVDFVVIDEKLAGSQYERTVLHADGTVRFRVRELDGSGWMTARQLSPFWGRLRYASQLRKLRACR